MVTCTALEITEMNKLFFIILFLFFTAAICPQTINVSSYDYKTTADCVEDWIVTDIADYEGEYTFIHFGHHVYNVMVKNGNVTIEERFESLSANERTILKETGITGNKLVAEISPFESLKARFVRLKCDIDQYILKGFIGLLVNEELMYIVIGD